MVLQKIKEKLSLQTSKDIDTALEAERDRKESLLAQHDELIRQLKDSAFEELTTVKKIKGEIRDNELEQELAGQRIKILETALNAALEKEIAGQVNAAAARAEKARKIAVDTINKEYFELADRLLAVVALQLEADKLIKQANDMASQNGIVRRIYPVMKDFEHGGLYAASLTLALPSLNGKAGLHVENEHRAEAVDLLKSKGAWFDPAELPNSPEALAVAQEMKKEADATAKAERRAKAVAERKAREEAESERTAKADAEQQAKQEAGKQSRDMAGRRRTINSGVAA
jgi:hypothetical protein